MAIVPDVLPPETRSRGATQYKLVTPLSRRKFRKEYRLAFATIKKLETIAYYTIPLYRKGVTKIESQFKGELTGYHQWVLLKVRQISSKLGDSNRTAEIAHALEEAGGFTYAEYCKDWINWID